MLKKLFLAVVPLTMLAANVKANDDLAIDVGSIIDAEVSIVDAALDIDVDQLSADAGTEANVENGDEAIEACFRRIGYRHRGWGYGYNHCYNRCYNHCHVRPLYSYRTICYAPPVYHCATPVYSYYWGCY